MARDGRRWRREAGNCPGARVRSCCLPFWGDPKRPQNGACRQSCGRVLPSRKRMLKDP